MKRALIIIAIILLIAAVVGIVLLGNLMLNNYAETGSIFGSSFDKPGSFWENVIGDEILNEVRPDEPTEEKQTSAPPIDQGNYIFEELPDGTYSVKLKDPSAEGEILTFPTSFNGKPVTMIKKSVEINVTVRQVIIPDSVTVINDNAFCNFTSLESVVFGKNVAHVRPSAFMNCIVLKNVQFNENLEHIYDSAFENCYSLEFIDLPEGLQSIQNSAFLNCSGLKQINIPSSVFYIGRSAFARCDALTHVYVPGNNMQELHEDIFYGCQSLETAELGNGITTVAHNMFGACTNLKEVKLPSTLKTIGSFAFLDCTSLKYITLPYNLSTIKEGAFANCSSLEKLELPSSLNHLELAFTNCSSLKSLTVAKGNATYYDSDNCIIDRTTRTLVYGLSGCIIPNDNSVVIIGPQALEGITALASPLPDSLKIIDFAAFRSSFRRGSAKYENKPFHSRN